MADLKVNAQVLLSGSLNETGPTEIQNITASYALTATTASYLLGSIASSSFAITSSYATTASFALTNAGTVTSAATASLALGGTGSFTGSFNGIYTGTFTGNGAGITGVLTSSYTLSSSLATTALNAVTATFAPQYLPLSGGVVIGSTSFAKNVEIDGILNLINIHGLNQQSVTTTVNTEQSISFTDGSGSFFVNFNSDYVASSPKLQFILSGSTGSFQFVNGNLYLTSGTLFATASLTGSAVLTGTFSGQGSGLLGIVTSSYALITSNLNGLATYSSVNIGTLEIGPLNQVPSTGSTFNTNVVKLFVNPGTGSDAIIILPTGSLGTTFWIQNVGNSNWRVLINSGNLVGASTNLQAIYPGYYGEATWTSAGVWRTTNSGFTATASLANTASFAITASAATSITFVPPTASFTLTASVALSTAYTSSYALNAGIATLATTASYGSGTFFAMLSFSSSNATNAINATLAQTASYGSGTFFAQQALSSSYAITASYALVSIPSISSSYATTASNATNAINATLAQTASYVQQAVSSSYATTASNATNAINATLAQTASYGSGTFFAQAALSASYALTASNATNAIGATSAQTASYVLNAVSASYVLNAVSASYALTASNATNAINATTAQSASYGSGTFFAQAALSSSYTLTASYALNGSGGSSVSSSYALTASYASVAQSVLNPAVSASYALTASFALNGGTGGGGGGSVFATGSTPLFTQFPFTAEYGFTTLVNPVPVGLTELDPSLRFIVDLRNAVSASTYAHITASGPSGSWLTMQYSTDEVNWTSFTSLSLMNTGTSMSIYSPVPVTESTQVIVRAVTTNGDNATNAELGSFGLGIVQNFLTPLVTASQFITFVSGSGGPNNQQLTSSYIVTAPSDTFLVLDPNTGSLQVSLPTASYAFNYNIRHVGISGTLTITNTSNVTQSALGPGMYNTYISDGLRWYIY